MRRPPPGTAKALEWGRVWANEDPRAPWWKRKLGSHCGTMRHPLLARGRRHAAPSSHSSTNTPRGVGTRPPRTDVRATLRAAVVVTAPTWQPSSETVTHSSKGKTTAAERTEPRLPRRGRPREQKAVQSTLFTEADPVRPWSRTVSEDPKPNCGAGSQDGVTPGETGGGMGGRARARGSP